jgi:acetyltransferase-like isoleucine patch superfamily enzyme
MSGPRGLAEVTGTWDYGALPSNIHVGEGCFIEMPDSFERCRSRQNPAITLGDRVRVFGWTRFNLEPTGVVEVGEDSVLVGALLMGAERITIGARVVISYFAIIADSDFHPRTAEDRRRDSLALLPGGDPSQRAPLTTAPVMIEDDARIGIGAIVLKGVRIGAGARVEAGTVLTHDVPPGAYAAGNPARITTER